MTLMSLNGEWPEEGSTENRESESNTSSSDELAAFFNLPRGPGEMMVIRTLQRFIGPIFVPIFRPLIRQLVEEHIEMAKQELSVIMKENRPNETTASTSVIRRLKLKFRNRIDLPVFTGIPLLGENKKPIDIALIDAHTEQIVNTGDESTAKLEIMGFQVGDDDDGWTFEEFQERIMSGRKGRRILQGNTCLQLKDGVGFVHEIHFTHDSKHAKSGFYRLVAMVVDATLMKQVEVAWTETFVVKDKRSRYYEKHPYPFLLDKVCHLQQIRYKGSRYKHLKKAEVETVKDLLILLYTDRKRLEDILELKASSKIWDDIVKNAQASNGMFLYLNPRKAGVVLDVRLQIKALIVEPHLYIPVDHLFEQQKVEAEHLLKFASEHLKALAYFEDEISLREYLLSDPCFTLLPDGPPRTFSRVAEASLNNSNQTPFLTYKSEREKEKAPFDDQEHISFRPHSPKGLKFWSGTEPSTSDISKHTLEDLEFSHLVNYVSDFLYESSNNE